MPTAKAHLFCPSVAVRVETRLKPLSWAAKGQQTNNKQTTINLFSIISPAFFSDQVIWPSISRDLLVLHIEIQVTVFDDDEANAQKAQYVENH